MRMFDEVIQAVLAPSSRLVGPKFGKMALSAALMLMSQRHTRANRSRPSFVLITMGPTGKAGQSFLRCDPLNGTLSSQCKYRCGELACGLSHDMDLELMQKKGTNKTTGESNSTDPTAQNTSRTAFLIKVMDAYCKTMLYCNICIQADKQVYFYMPR